MKKYWAVLSIGFILGLWSSLSYASGTNLLNLISFTPTEDYVNAVYKAGNYIYVADGMAGLKIFEAIQDSGTNSLRLIGEYKITSGDILDVQVQGKYCYITNGEDGLIIIDISNPQEPELVSRCDTSICHTYRTINEFFFQVFLSIEIKANNHYVFNIINNIGWNLRFR